MYIIGLKLEKNIGTGITGAEFRGYQTAPVKNENLIVEVLDRDGNSIKNLKKIISWIFYHLFKII